MSQVSFIGMVSYDIDYSAYNEYGEGIASSANPIFIEIMAQVGASHHMVKLSNREDFKILSNDQLAKYSWHWTIAIAQKSFEQHKARKLAEQ